MNFHEVGYNKSGPDGAQAERKRLLPLIKVSIINDSDGDRIY